MDTLAGREVIDLVFNNNRVAAADDFTKAMLKIKEAKLTTHMVFAADAMIIAKANLLQSRHRPWQTVQKLTTECWNCIKHADLNTGSSGPFWSKSDVHFVVAIHDANKLVNDSAFWDVVMKAGRNIYGNEAAHIHGENGTLKRGTYSVMGTDSTSMRRTHIPPSEDLYHY